MHLLLRPEPTSGNFEEYRPHSMSASGRTRPPRRFMRHARCWAQSRNPCALFKLALTVRLLAHCSWRFVSTLRYQYHDTRASRWSSIQALFECSYYNSSSVSLKSMLTKIIPCFLICLLVVAMQNSKQTTVRLNNKTPHQCHATTTYTLLNLNIYISITIYADPKYSCHQQ